MPWLVKMKFIHKKEQIIMLRVIEVCNVCIEVIKTNEENSSVHSFIKMEVINWRYDLCIVVL